MASDFISNGWRACEENGIVDSGLIEFLQLKGSNGIVIDGLIAWIDLNLDCVAEDLWMVKTLETFSEDEVNSAKTALWAACEMNIGETIPRRQGENKKKSDVNDIVKALKKLQGSNVMPLILSTGKMMMRTPVAEQVSRDSSDNNLALKVSTLESSMNSFIKQQTDQMTELKNLINMSSNPPASMVRPPVFKHVRAAAVIDGSTASPNKRKRHNENNSEDITIVTTAPPGPNSVSEPSFSSVAKLGNQNVNGIKQLNNDRPPRRPSIMYGTSKVGNDENVELLAADVALVASGVSKDASPQQLKDFIEGKGIRVVAIDKLTRDDADSRTNTFKIVVKLADYDKAMKPDVWPYRVGVRHYRPPRRQGLSWDQQTGQSQHAWRSTGRGNPYTRGHGQLYPPPGQQQSQSPFSLELKNRYELLAGQNQEVFYSPN